MSEFCPIIINGSNLVSDSFNNKFRFDFQGGQIDLSRAKMSLSNISLYYSWFNITAAQTNNVFQISFPKAAITLYTLTIPDGSYSIDQLNAYVQFFSIQNGLYLINAAGDYVYYIEFQTNSSLYAVQINLFPLPLALPGGWTNPGGLTFNAVSQTPQVIILSNNFTNIVGFSAGTYPAAPALVQTSITSNITPQVSPVQSLILAVDILNNRVASPSTLLYSFSPAESSGFGTLINSRVSEYFWVPIRSGNRSSFVVSILDQNGDAIKLNDTNLIIQLLLAFE
jgi:hypothetical protein